MRYILKKDLPKLKMGAEFVLNDFNGEYISGIYSFTKEDVESMPDWFQPCTIVSVKNIEDKKWTDEDMQRCWNDGWNNANQKTYRHPYKHWEDYLREIEFKPINDKKDAKIKNIIDNNKIPTKDDIGYIVTPIAVDTHISTNDIGLYFFLKSIDENGECFIFQSETPNQYYCTKTHVSNLRIVDRGVTGYVKPNETNSVISTKETPINKPTLGLMPKWMYDEQRLGEINDAIKRYDDAKKDVPTEWIAERDLLYISRKERKLQNGDYPIEDVNKLNEYLNTKD